MNQVTPFFFNGDRVRVVLKEQEPWFVGRDVALCLGYSNPQKAIQDHCKRMNLFKGNDSLLLDSPRGLLIIPEPDVYRLIMRSKLPAAERFEEWVFEEVLPAIRRNGRYVPAAIPENAPLYLRPALRDRAMNYAVQAARISGGTEADIDRLFVKYCAMLGPGRSQEGTIGPDPFGVGRFLDERCELDQELHETNDDLFAAYNRFRFRLAPRPGPGARPFSRSCTP